jgi:anti-sigma factor RsiW
MTPERDDLLPRLLGPAAPEVSCDACFERLDAYVEAELRGAPVDPALTAHLHGCPACAEDHAGLLALVRSER